jgi:phosphoserine phosphatase
MNIALYGVPRSGKNHLIKFLLESINSKVAKTLYYVNGSGNLNRLSNDKYGIPFKETDEDQKKLLRLMFCDELITLKNDYHHKIVDGHYCFFKNQSFDAVFTDKDRDVYDIFFYLDTPTDIIIKQANLGKEKKDIASMSLAQINKWKEFEIQSLRKICLAHNKEFVVIDNNIEDCIDFFETLLIGTRDVLLDSKEIAKHIINKHKKQIDEYRNIIILDCDRTISNNDTTYDFCLRMNIDKQILKNIFSGEYYTLYQFFRTAKLYAEKNLSIYESASIHAFKKAILNTSLIKDIKQNGSNYLCIGITSGILRTWEKIRDEYQFPDIIEGGSNLKTDKIVVSREVKYYLVKFLCEEGKYVIAVGDSIVDIDMLNEASKGFIVAQEKASETIKKYLSINKTEIMQLGYSKLHYNELNCKRSLFL